MNRKALIKDFFIEIKRSYTRFLSILLIVALGVAFFAGVRAASPDMKRSADAYYDSSNFMDFRVISELGLTNEDVEAIKNIAGVEAVVGEYTTDVMTQKGQNKYVLRLTSLPQTLNEVTIVKGRLPQNNEECFVDQKLIKQDGFKIGDYIEVEEEKTQEEGEQESSIAVKRYKIVGYGNSPYYLSFDRGTSSIGDGSLSGFVMVQEGVFNLEVFTQISVQAKDSKDFVSYSDDYKNHVDAIKNKVEDIAKERSELRYQSVRMDAQKKIKENEDKLEDSRIQLEDAKDKIEEGETKLLEGKEEIAKNEKLLADSKSTLEKSKKELNQGKEALNKAKKTLDSSKDELTSGQKAFDEGMEELEAKKLELNSANASIEEAQKTLREKEEEYLRGVNGYEALVTALKGQKDQLEALKKIAATGDEEASKQVAILEAMIPGMEEKIQTTKVQLDQSKIQLDQGKDILNAKKIALDAGNSQLAQADAKLKETQRVLNEGWKQYESGLSQVTEQEKILHSGEKKLVSGQKEYQSGKEKLTDAKNKLETEERKLLDGKESFEKESKEAYEKITDGEEKLKKAKEDLEDLRVPKWHLLDRNTVQNYVEYGQDTERIAAIGEVFPAIFFLVAALICLTTMTRMVEENRIQIGTLKALGYSKVAIASKYIAYAFFATLGGSIIGLLIGQLLLPKVIINAYKILYYNLPNVLTPIHTSYSITSSVLAIACTTCATILACYKELRCVPAALMRPMAPKNGKRVILERIPFVWKRLSFSNKATVRNLIRYKKRFFMTIFGIGGCMGLLLVGFGVKDSIMAIGDLQFREIRLYDSTITLKDEVTKEDIKQVKKILDEEAGIEKSLSIYEKTVDVSKEDVTKSSYLMVPGNKDELSEFVALRDRITKEKYKLDENGVIITEKLAKLLDIKVGETITLNDDEKHKVEAKVSHIVENYFYHYIMMSPNYYKTLYGHYPTFTQFYTKNNDKSVEYEGKLQNKLMKDKMIEHVTFVRTISGRIHDMLKSMDAIIVVLVVSAGLLAFVVLYNLNNVNISERKRELATLKVLGFYELEVSEYVFRENICLTMIGSLLGIFIGFLLHRFVIVTAEIDLMMFGRIIKPLSYIYSIGFTIIFSMLVNIVMHFKLKKIDMVVSMKSVE